jgi:hypothetical protein
MTFRFKGAEWSRVVYGKAREGTGPSRGLFWDAKFVTFL